VVISLLLPSSLPLLRLAEVDSTQAFLRRHPELGFVGVLAEAQTAGRGRQGNRWESAPGAGLWLSAALPPQAVPPGLLLQRAMAAVIGVLGRDDLGLKWPNDLVARRDGRLCKLGGIIGEVVGGRTILGLGLNLHSAPELPERTIPAAALADLGGPVPEAPALVRALLDAWQHLATAPEPPFRWPAEGDPLRWEGGQGVCLGWEPDGRLKLATAQGIQRLSAGEVQTLGTVLDK
jgi:BirA family biotin operon repressor/biotin-[acetyl-CoA-carboxylase] ligase